MTRARPSRVERLAADAAEAARLRALMTNPDVVALRVERIRAQCDALLWVGILLGLAYTLVNVQQFAADGAPAWSPGWLVAWLLDPMVSLVLIAVLRAEQVTARYQVALPRWARRTKWLAFAATYLMNTWESWGFGDEVFSASGVVLHSVPPLVVYAAAETGPELRDRLTEAVRRSLLEHEQARTTVPLPIPPPIPDATVAAPDPEPAPAPDPDPAPAPDPTGAPDPQPGTAPDPAAAGAPAGPRRPGRKVPPVEAVAALVQADVDRERALPSMRALRKRYGLGETRGASVMALLRPPPPEPVDEPAPEPDDEPVSLRKREPAPVA